jgi:hypothetical protein
MKRRKTDPKKRTSYEKRTSMAEARKAISAAHKRLCGGPTVNWNGGSPKKEHPGKEAQKD